MLKRLRDSADRFQKSHPWFSFGYRVLAKFREDRAGQQAALLAYYGFFSLFPLLLVAVTVLGIFLRNNPDLQTRILNSALSQFPIIGSQIGQNLHAMKKAGAGLFIGLAGALWGGLGGLKGLQNAMDHVWDVPIDKRAATVRQIVRAVVMLGVLAVFVGVSLGLTASGAATQHFPVIGRVVTLVGATGVNVIGFLLLFKLLTVAEVSWRDVLPGAVVAGVGWAALQAVGNYYVGHQLKSASELYGFFGIVLGLLSWMYLGAQLTLLAAEVNVVRKRGSSGSATVAVSHRNHLQRSGAHA